MEQNCGNCQLANFPMTKHKPPRFMPHAGAKCEWKLVVPCWPDSIRPEHRNFYTTHVTPEMGKTCPCHIPRK